MTQERNVDRFNEDVRHGSGYAYSGPSAPLSSRMANRRLSDAIAEVCDLRGRSVLDVGCGDGVYTAELLDSMPSRVLAIDAAEDGIACAQAKGMPGPVEFRRLDVYDLGSLNERFDVAVVRGVLHHLYEPKKAIEAISRVASEAVVVEPNGYNPILKVIEKTSRYHIEHEERSYSPRLLRRWFAECGGSIERDLYCGLVPCFCPDAAAKFLKRVEPLVESVPVMRQFSCAVYVFRVRFR